jgi:hypothetical protein
MTFAPYQPSGQAVLVPCAARIEHRRHLVGEAEALWKAECPRASEGSIGALWGCVGVLFTADSLATDLRNEWADHFSRSKTCPIFPVDNKGLLGIPWPTTGDNNMPIDVDVILATATCPQAFPAKPSEIAEAWVKQYCGYEKYFFENVRHGIRTPEDQEIWKGIEAQTPPWLDCEAYAEAIALLRAEATRDA